MWWVLSLSYCMRVISSRGASSCSKCAQYYKLYPREASANNKASQLDHQTGQAGTCPAWDHRGTTSCPLGCDNLIEDIIHLCEGP